MISLGCAKNLVDAEIMLGDAIASGFEITADPDDADVLVVNTCGFIESAKRESIEAILEARRRPSQKLVVSGCLAQRYGKQLARELPEVDAFMGLDEVATAGKVFQQVLSSQQAFDLWISSRSRYIPDYDTPRFRLTAGPYRLCKDRGGLQSSLHLLRDSADARAPSQSLHTVSNCGSPPSRRRRSKGD